MGESQGKRLESVTVKDAVERFLADFKARANGPKKERLRSYQTAKGGWRGTSSCRQSEWQDVLAYSAHSLR